MLIFWENLSNRLLAAGIVGTVLNAILFALGLVSKKD